ncbi:hypothetical protein D3C84_963180 [compost metagenome]
MPEVWVIADCSIYIVRWLHLLAASAGIRCVVRDNVDDNIDAIFGRFFTHALKLISAAQLCIADLEVGWLIKHPPFVPAHTAFLRALDWGRLNRLVARSCNSRKVILNRIERPVPSMENNAFFRLGWKAILLPCRLHRAWRRCCIANRLNHQCCE